MKTDDSNKATSGLFNKGNNGEGEMLFREHFEVKPFMFQHRLSNDPCFGMDRIRALAKRLPAKIGFNGHLPVKSGFKQPDGRKLSFEETLETIESGQSWIILKKVHEDEEYGPHLRQCLSEVQELTHQSLEGLIESRTMSLILSSPGQVTPYHIDADCNFLFQIRGCKTFYVFNGRDRAILSEKEEEDFWAGNLNAAQYREEYQRKAWEFKLQSGNGVHVPVIFPHWVKNGANLSISLSMNFRFHGRIRGDVYRTNHFMRKMGLKPRPVGESRLADAIKVMIISRPRSSLHICRRILQRLK